MNLMVVNLTGVEARRIPNPERRHCDGAVFRDDYAQCTNIAIKRRGQWRLCAPHVRKDELEILVDTDSQV